MLDEIEFSSDLFSLLKEFELLVIRAMNQNELVSIRTDIHLKIVAWLVLLKKPLETVDRWLV